MSRTLYESSGSEIDLRSELESMFSGGTGEISKQQKFVLRRARRTADNEVIPCDCVDVLTKEPDLEHQCPFCLGEGFIWDEQFIFGYCMYTDTKGHLSQKRVQMPPGLVSSYDKVFYLRYSEEITFDDKIIELKLDSDGSPSVPYKRKYIYKPQTISEFRSDFGRREFFAIYVNENDAIRVK